MKKIKKKDSLSKEQLYFYEQNGFLKIENVFEEEEIKALRKDLDDFSDGHYTSKVDSHYYGTIQKIHTGKKLCDIGDAILNDRSIPIGSIAFYCKPNNPLEHGSTWHQDNYAGRTPDGNNYLTLTVALDDADADNGALMVIPGSHKWGELPCNPKPNFSRDNQGRLYASAPTGNNVDLPSDCQILQLDYKAGDVLALGGLLVHGAKKNEHKSRWRRSIYLIYIKDGEPFWPGFTSKRCLLERYDSPNYKLGVK